MKAYITLMVGGDFKLKFFVYMGLWANEMNLTLRNPARFSKKTKQINE